MHPRCNGLCTPSYELVRFQVQILMDVPFMSRTKRKLYPPYGELFDTTNDGKKWFKPPKWFKKMKKSQRKAKEKDAFRHEQDAPIFKKTDGWDWT